MNKYYKQCFTLVAIGVFGLLMGMWLISCGSTWNVSGNEVNVTVVNNDTIMYIKAGSKIIEPNETTE